MGFEKSLILMITKSIQNISKFELSIDSLNKNFDNGCPIKDKLFNIIKSKNNISNALIQIQSQLNNLNSTQTTLENSTKIFSGIINTVKSIPAPTAVAGVGIPISIITRLSEVLDNMGDKLKRGKGLLSIIPTINKDILNYINNINQNIKNLDNKILKCLETQFENMNETEKQKFISELGSNVSESDIENDINVVSSYKDYKFIIEYDPLNKFTFPRRRIRAENGKITILGDYSYSSSTDILIKEMKFKIDNNKK